MDKVLRSFLHTYILSRLRIVNGRNFTNDHFKTAPNLIYSYMRHGSFSLKLSPFLSLLEKFLGVVSFRFPPGNFPFNLAKCQLFFDFLNLLTLLQATKMETLPQPLIDTGKLAFFDNL